MVKYESPWADMFKEEKEEKPKKEKKPNRNKYFRFELQCDPVVDKKIIKWMQQQPNRAEYIRQLVYEDIKHQRNHRRYLREKANRERRENEKKGAVD